MFENRSTAIDRNISISINPDTFVPERQSLFPSLNLGGIALAGLSMLTMTSTDPGIDARWETDTLIDTTYTAPPQSSLLDLADVQCRWLLTKNLELYAALTSVCQQIQLRPEVESLRLSYVKDPESGWEQIFVRISANLSVDEELALENQIVDDIPDRHWQHFSAVAFSVG